MTQGSAFRTSIGDTAPAGVGGDLLAPAPPLDSRPDQRPWCESCLQRRADLLDTFAGTRSFAICTSCWAKGDR